MTVGPVQKDGLGIVKYNAAIQITSRTVKDTIFEAAMMRGGLEADHVHVTNDKRGDVRGSIKYCTYTWIGRLFTPVPKCEHHVIHIGNIQPAVVECI